MVWANDEEQLKVDVPLVFKGLDNCPGIKKGGNLRSMRSSLKLVGPAEHIPSKIEVDVSQLDIEDKVLLQEVVFHPSLKLLSKNETLPVCKIAATSPVKEQESCSSISKVLEKTNVQYDFTLDSALHPSIYSESWQQQQQYRSPEQ